jgi:hypothetical protein
MTPGNAPVSSTYPLALRCQAGLGAGEALTFYGNVFGCAVQLHTFAEFNRAGGPADAMAHGYLTGGLSRCLAPTDPGRAALPVRRHDGGPAWYCRSPGFAHLVLPRLR